MNLFTTLNGLLAALALSGGLIIYHLLTVASLTSDITNLTQENTTYINQISAFETAQATNLTTIAGLEEQLATQQTQIRSLQTSVNNIAADRDRYLAIFRQHDLTRLSRARPGLIEPLINNGTRDVFSTLEDETRELHDAYENPNRSSTSSND